MAWTQPTPTEVTALFAAQRRDDPFGTRLHLVVAALWCFFLSWPTTYSEWAIVPLAACFVVRMITHHGVLGPLVWDRVTRLAIGWGVWLSLSVLWSAAPDRWADDLGGLRYGLLIPFLWPVMDRRNVLIAAMMAGILCGNASQLVHAVAIAADASWMPWNRDPARVSGWWDPVVGGTLLVGALGLVVGSAWSVVASGAWRRRIRARAGFARSRAGLAALALIGCIMLAAIVATGTRGAYIAAAALLGTCAVIAVPRLPRRVRGRAAAGVVAAALAVVIGAGALVLAVPAARERVERGRDEVRRVFAEGDFDSDTGARLLMWREAVFAAAGSPINGVGAGGYKAWALARLRAASAEDGSTRTDWPIHSHAHSMWLHAVATTGGVGLGLLAALVLAGIVSGLGVRFGDNPGPALALVGLSLAGMFDTVHVNQQTAAMLWTMLAMCGTVRPRGAGGVA